ncbi:tetratricopeptide repeat protein [Oleidesulfovibrio sp.]|uniref:tetratricopeptide repeat protein n=1 Tax=Oleidesulfovibrio sp. TaxID=2909707 RepID=UPI003A8A1E68
MTNNATQGPAFGPSHKVTKAILAALGVSLVVMLATSFIYRMNHPSLTKPGRAPQQASQEQMMDQASTDELTQLMRMMQEDPNNTEVLETLAQRFMDAGDWDRAQTFLNKLVIATPGDTGPLYMLGITLYQQGKHQEAADTFEQLLALQDDPMARFNLSVLYGHFLNQPDKAKPHLEAILASDQASDELKARAQDELARKAHGDK